MMRPCGLAALLVTLAGPCLTAQTPADRVRARADSLLLSLHERGLFNGAVVLGRTGEPLYARGFGPANLAAGVAFTPDTPADGASITKTLAAASVFMLVQEDRLKLDDRVQQHLPEYPHPQTRVRDLISHTTGLPEAEYDFFNDLMPADQVRTTALLVNLLRQQAVPLDFEPGTRFRYSSIGFDVAVLVVERLTGQRWDAFLQERVFGPLHLDNTFLRWPRLGDWQGVRTMSYRPDGDSLVVEDVFDNEGFYGGSNLYFSARDLYRWSQSFYTRPILQRETLARGGDAVTLRDPATGYGGRSGINLLGWYYPGQGRRYHYPGSLQGFWSSAYRDEDQGYSVIYVSNNSIPQWLRPLLTRALMDIMEGRTPAAIQVPEYSPFGAGELDAIAGRYAVDGVGNLVITRNGRHAMVRIGEGIEYPAYRLSGSQFYVPGQDVWIGFTAGPSGPFEQLHWLSIFRVTTGTRRR